MRPRHFLSLLGLAAAAAVVPEIAAAQAPAPGPAPAPVTCYQCVRKVGPLGGYFECAGGYNQGGTSCSVTNNGQLCTLTGDCVIIIAPAADQVASNADLDALLDEGAEALPSGVVRFASATGEVQLRSRCNGAVLARAYTATRAEELRRASETLTL